MAIVLSYTQLYHNQSKFEKERKSKKKIEAQLIILLITVFSLHFTALTVLLAVPVPRLRALFNIV